MKSLREWLIFLEAKTASHLDPKTCFQAVQTVIKRLGISRCADYTIAVTGTNGKGSVVACLEQLAIESSIAVGSGTSPHLLRFNERIKLDGIPVSDERIIAAFHEIEQVSADLELNYMQYAYVAGFIILKQANLSLAILEVGMGGRYDAVNALHNDMTVITNVDLDHCDKLGATRELIGLEKVMLSRKNMPLILGDRDCPRSVLAHAKKQQAVVYQLGLNFDYEEEKHTWSWFHDHERIAHLTKPMVMLQNAATALMAFACYQKKHMNHELVNAVFKQLYLPGRCQLVQRECLWWFDVAHNPQAISHLAARLAEQRRRHAGKPRRVYAICGMMAEKDIAGSLRFMVELIDEWHVCRLPVPRSASQMQLKAIMALLQIKNFHYHDNPENALDAVKQKVTQADWVVVFGSFVTVSRCFVEEE